MYVFFAVFVYSVYTVYTAMYCLMKHKLAHRAVPPPVLSQLPVPALDSLVLHKVSVHISISGCFA